MNTKFLLSLFILTSVCLTSCKKELEPQDSTKSSIPVAVETPEIPVNTIQNKVETPQNTISKTSQANPVAAGLNPPHGQNGHRCDIAVGAPLNSAPNPPQAPQAAPAPMNPNTANVITEIGMNPPHGQEGHLCEIAVGAPLPKV